MPMYKLTCTKCDLVFDKILHDSNITEVHCSKCDSTDIIRVSPHKNSQYRTTSNAIPSGALSGGSCSSGFS